MANDTINYQSKNLVEFLEQTGTIRTADTLDLLSVAKADLKEVFGGDLSTEPTMPAGRLAEWVAVFLGNALRVNVQNANQLLLSSAAGQQLDSIAQWFRISRKPATRATVTATVTVSGATTFPAGTRARTVDGEIFQSVDKAEFTGDGVQSKDILFEALNDGPVVCAANTLTIRDTPREKWSKITNVDAAKGGSNVETDDELRERIANCRTDGIGFLGAIKSAIEDIPGVKSSIVIENNTNHEKVVQGIEMAPHSIFVCVDGPQDMSDVVRAVFNTKPCGTGYTNLSSSAEKNVYTFTDPYGLEYDVVIHTPEHAQIAMSVHVVRRGYVGDSLENDIKNAVKDYFATAEYKIGETVYASDVIVGIEDRVPGIVVVNAFLSDGGADVSAPNDKSAYANDALVSRGSFVEIQANCKASAVDGGGSVKINVVEL